MVDDRNFVRWAVGESVNASGSTRRQLMHHSCATSMSITVNLPAGVSYHTIMATDNHRVASKVRSWEGRRLCFSVLTAMY